MPRTRNVSRSQWDAANAINSSKSKENGYDSEKENSTRATRSRTTTGAGRTTLGAVTTARPAGSKSKGKGKPRPAGPPTMLEKLPFQDITARFLPAAESQNRGYPQHAGFGVPENMVASPVASSSNPFAWPLGNKEFADIPKAVFPSSLPPSSPPSAYSIPATSQRQLPFLSSPTPVVDNVARRLFQEADSKPVYDAWREFDFKVGESEASSRPQATPRNSDPFGFFALERKLKVEREEEAEGLVLKKDHWPGRSSSEAPPQVPGVNSPFLPPTPHKKRVKGDGSLIFNIDPSSCSTSPSPSKPQQRSSVKRKVAADFDRLHEGVQEATSLPKKVSRTKRAKTVVPNDEEPTLRRSQRKKRDDNASPVVEGSAKRKSRSTKVPRKQAKPCTKKSITKKATKQTAILPADDSDGEEKREQERQARLEYFRKLDDYEVETENVYVV